MPQSNMCPTVINSQVYVVPKSNMCPIVINSQVYVVPQSNMCPSDLATTWRLQKVQVAQGGCGLWGQGRLRRSYMDWRVNQSQYMIEWTHNIWSTPKDFARRLSPWTKKEEEFQDKPALQAQPALDVLGIIAFPSSRNKGKIISPPFTEYEFTRSLPVAQCLPTSDVRNVLPRLSQTSPIEVIFGVGRDVLSSSGCN